MNRHTRFAFDLSRLSGANELETVRLVSAAQLVPLGGLRPGLPRDLESICLKALSHSIADRYPTAGSLAADLRRFTNGVPTEARPLGQCRRTLRWIKHRPVRSGMTAIILVLIGALHTERIWCVAAWPDGNRLATASADNTVKLWPLRPAQAVVAIDHPVSLKNVAFMADGQTLVAVMDDGGLSRWHWRPPDVSNGPGVSPLAHGGLIGRSTATAVGHIRDMKVSSRGTLAAVRVRDTSVELVRVRTGELIAELAAPAESRDDVNEAVVFSPNGRMLAQAVGSSVRIWDLASRKIVRRFESKARIFALAFSAPFCAIAKLRERRAPRRSAASRVPRG